MVYTPYSPSTPGAAGMRVASIQNALHDHGMESHVLTPADGKGIALARRIGSIKSKPDYVLATSPPLPPTFWAMIGARIAGCPFILDAKEDGRALHILTKEKPSLKEKAYLALRKWVYLNADRVWFLTQRDQEEAVQRYALPLIRTQVVTNGTDSRLTFIPGLKKRSSQRKSLSIPSRDKVILYAGSLGDEDVFSLVKEGFSTLPSNVFLLFAVSVDPTPADQHQLNRLNDQLSKMGLNSRSRVLTNVPISDMQSLLSLADVGVLPWNDAYPTSLPVKIFDYAGAGIRTLARCSLDSMIHEFLEKNPTWGTDCNDWSAFRAKLKKELKKIRTPAARKKFAQSVSKKWDRKKIMSDALDQTFESFK
ncbi:MAG: glycosyltransferase [archaeon]